MSLFSSVCLRVLQSKESIVKLGANAVHAIYKLTKYPARVNAVQQAVGDFSATFMPGRSLTTQDFGNQKEEFLLQACSC